MSITEVAPHSGLRDVERTRLTTPAHRARAASVIGPIAALLGVIGALISVIGTWMPAFWGNEAASIMSAERFPSAVWWELGLVDAVHGAYYAFLHYLIDAFGASELSVRLPSAIAVGVAVTGTVVLADRLFLRSASSRAIAVIAGVVMMLLPGVDYMAAEGRSYAIGTAVAVWLTVFFVTLLERRVTRRLPWIAFAVVFAVSISVFLYPVLLAAVFGVAILAARPGRAVIRRWSAAIAGGIVLAAPVIAYALGEHGLISFLANRGYVTFPRIFVIQWFGNPWLAIACWALIAIAVVTLIRSQARPVALLVALPVALLVGWLVLPMAILVFGDVFIAPIYSIRYLSSSTPAVAILAASGVCALVSRGAAPGWIRVPAVLALVDRALAIDVFQRLGYTISRRIPVHRTVVYELSRETP